MFDIIDQFIRIVSFIGGFIFGLSILLGLLILFVVFAFAGRADRRMRKFQEDLTDYERRFE